MTHVIVAAEPRAYRETIAAAIRSMRPDITVSEVGPTEIDQIFVTSRPDVVLCSHLSAQVQRFAPAWVLLYNSHSRDSLISVEGQVRVQQDIDFEEILKVVDEVEALTARSA